MTIWNVGLREAIRTMPAGILSGGKSESVMIAVDANGPRPDVLRDFVARQLAFPVKQPAWHGGVGDRRLPEGPPRLIASAVRAVKDVGAGRFGIDDRAPFDPPHLFREEWIVGDVRLRLLRQGIGRVELVRVGQPDDLRQRFLPRPAHLRVALRPPRDADWRRRRARRQQPRAARGATSATARPAAALLTTAARSRPRRDRVLRPP